MLNFLFKRPLRQSPTSLAWSFIIGVLLQSCSSQQSNVAALSANDPALRFRNGVLFYEDQPFSGVITATYANGQLQTKTEYARGREHGTSSMWYEGGQLLWQREYRNGKKHGEHKGWWPNGARKFVYHFADGEHEGEASEWYANGPLAQRNQYLHGQEVGLQQAWRENGKLYANYLVKNGKRYGLVNSRLCYTVKDGEVQSD